VTLKEQFIHSDKPLLVFDRGDCEVSGEPMKDAKFPNTDDILPKYGPKDGVVFGCDPKLLGEMEAVFDAANPERERAPVHQVVADDKAMLITFKGENLTAIGLFMPVKIVASP
jgi:hypothetical protein